MSNISPSIEHQTYSPSTTDTPETVETAPWTSLADGTPLYQWDRLAVIIRSLSVAPGVSTHKIYSVELVLEIEEGGPVVSNVSGPVINGDPVSWDYSSASGFPQTHYQVKLMAGIVADPNSAPEATDTLDPADGECFYDSGQVSSSTARTLAIPRALTSGPITFAVRAWTEFDNGVSVVSSWDVSTSDMNGDPLEVSLGSLVPEFDPETGTLSVPVIAPAGTVRAWLQRSIDGGATWADVEGNPFAVSSGVESIIDPSPPFYETCNYRAVVDRGPMTESGTPLGLGSAQTTAEGWYLQNPSDPSMNIRIDVAEVAERERQISVITEGEDASIVARSKRLGDQIQLTVRTWNEAERLALTEILDSRDTLRLVNVFGREWRVAPINDRNQQPVVVKPLDTETTGIRDFHMKTVTLREVV